MNIKTIFFTLSTVSLCLGVTKIHTLPQKLAIPDTAVGNQITQALQNNSYQKRVELLQTLIAQEEQKQSSLSTQTQQALLLATIEVFNQRTQNPELRTDIMLNLLKKIASSSLFNSSPELIALVKNQLLPNTKTNKEIVLVTNLTIDATLQATIKAQADYGVTGVITQQAQSGAQINQPNTRPKKAQQTQPVQKQQAAQTTQETQAEDINPLLQTEIQNINKLGLISGTIQALLNLINEVNNMPGTVNTQTQDVFSKSLLEAFNQGLANSDQKQNLIALLQSAQKSRLLAPNQKDFVRTNMLPKIAPNTQNTSK